ISVKAGDVLGMTTPEDGVGCGFGPSGELFYVSLGTDQPNGSPVTFLSDTGERLNISAVLEPTNAFTLGATQRNKTKGTATLNLTLPNPGKVVGSGNGATVSSAGPARVSKSVGAGQAQLLIKAKGRKRRKLNETGKVKLKVAITYTPTGGDANTQ